MKQSTVAIVALACLCGASAWAQDYPAKQVRLVLPFPPGGGSDIIARVVAQKLTGSLEIGRAHV